MPQAGQARKLPRTGPLSAFGVKADEWWASRECALLTDVTRRGVMKIDGGALATGGIADWGRVCRFRIGFRSIWDYLMEYFSIFLRRARLLMASFFAALLLFPWHSLSTVSTCFFTTLSRALSSWADFAFCPLR